MSTAAAVPAGAAAAPKKSKKLLIIILAVVVLLAAGGGAAAFLLMKKGGASHADEKHKPAEKKPSAPTVFAPLEPFTVNLADAGLSHYLQIGLTYEVAGNDVADALKAQMPLIRSRVLLILTNRTSEELATPKGKSQLAVELVALGRGALAASSAPGAQNDERGVIDIHFSSFIIQ
jgi:flagellar FliL protein